MTTLVTDPEGYSLTACSCAEGPYIGARRAGSPCCCERCGLITLEALEALVAAARSIPDKSCPRHPAWSGTSGDCAFCRREERDLSRMTFEARELIDMLVDITRGRDTWAERARDEIDAYRAGRGWSPDGFGGEG